MTHILMLTSSPRGPASLSSPVASAVAGRFKNERDATVQLARRAAGRPTTKEKT